MLQKLRNRINEEKGFTLIELLVVILIIGILAAIALPVFLGQQEKGQDSSAKADARNAFTQVEACYADTQDYDKCNESTELPKAKTGFDFQNSATTAGDTTKVAVTGASATGFVVSVYSKSGGLFKITKASGGTTRGCDKPSGKTDYSAGCNGGNW